MQDARGPVIFQLGEHGTLGVPVMTLEYRTYGLPTTLPWWRRLANWIRRRI